MSRHKKQVMCSFINRAVYNIITLAIYLSAFKPL